MQKKQKKSERFSVGVSDIIKQYMPLSASNRRIKAYRNFNLKRDI